MKKYTAYKTANFDWIGEYPNHWQLKRLKYIVALMNENEPDNYKLRKIALENIESYSGKLINLDSEVEFTGEGKKFDKGDVLFNKLRPYLAKVYKAVDKGICLGELLVLRPSCEITSDFLFYRVLSEPFISEVNSSTYGAKMPRASWEFIKNLGIPYPTLREQNDITQFLDLQTYKIDVLISKKQKLIGLLKEEHAVIINQAVTKGINPDAEMKDSGIEWLGKIPAHWEIKKIKYLSSIISKGTTPSTIKKEILASGSIRFIKAENIVENITALTPEFYIDEDTNQILKRSQLKEGDLLFVIAGATIGKVGIMKKEFLPANTNQAISFIRLKKQKDTKFVWYYLQSNSIQELIPITAVQAAQPNLSMEDLGNFSIPYPPNGEMQDIVLFIDQNINRISRAILKIQKEIDLLREYRTALISEVVTGKIDVREEVAAWT